MVETKKSVSFQEASTEILVIAALQGFVLNYLK